MPHASHWTYFPSDCIKFHLIYFSCFGVMLRTSFKKFNQQRAITQKILKVELRFCALHFNSMSSTTELRFIKFPLVIIRTKIKSSHLQRQLLKMYCRYSKCPCTMPTATVLSFIQFPSVVLGLCSGQEIGDRQDKPVWLQYASFWRHKNCSIKVNVIVSKCWGVH